MVVTRKALHYPGHDDDGLVQGHGISIADAMIPQSCTKPLTIHSIKSCKAMKFNFFQQDTLIH